MNNSFVWVDGRWQDDHWLEIFRIRLCGWIPASWVRNLVVDGFLTWGNGPGESDVCLAAKSLTLTDLRPAVEGDQYNNLMLANVLLANGYNKNWMAQTVGADVIHVQTDQKFPAVFSRKLASTIAVMQLSDPSIRTRDDAKSSTFKPR